VGQEQLLLWPLEQGEAGEAQEQAQILVVLVQGPWAAVEQAHQLLHLPQACSLQHPTERKVLAPVPPPQRVPSPLVFLVEQHCQH
jgi:hypothetical protein